MADGTLRGRDLSATGKPTRCPAALNCPFATTMRCLLSLLLMFALSGPGHALAQAGGTAAPVVSEFSRAELLVHAPQGVQAGQPLWLGLQITHAPDWHTYWKNPGDSGLPTELQWQLSPGATAGDIAWPTPRKFPIGDLANYGYDGTVLLPVPVTVTPSFQGDRLDVSLQASWLICRKECIPEEARFQLSIPAQVSTAGHAQAFQGAWSSAPHNQAAQSSSLQPADAQLAVRLEGLPKDWTGKPLEFFPETPGLIEPGKPWQQHWDGAVWTASLPLSPHRSESPAAVPLVVALAQPPGQGPGLPGRALTVNVTTDWPATSAAPTGVSDALAAALAENAARASAPPTGAGGWWLALLGALVGGVILNLMPCVFPVLAIKVLAFSRHGADRRAHRLGGLAYTLGVVLSFMALGGLLLGLRAAGEQLGWGFQLQNPAVVAGLATLFALIGLNLAGLFEFGRMLPSSWANLQARHPVADAFLTGVLATAIASPCTAPFMGASLGLAVTLPAAQALGVFAALGLGMALPYLLASWVPAVARALPRPGAWMDTFRQLMAFPMFATVVWLLWVLGQQSGIDGAAALLLLLVMLALVVWAVTRPGTSRRWLAPVAVAGLLWLGWSIGPQVTRLSDGHTNAAPTGVAGLTWEAWSPGREAELLAQGRPVFVDYTAAWCVTCQYNKRTTLADADVLRLAAEKRVALLRADWTRRDPEVTAALSRLGRNGVPVYVLHAAQRAPVVLSEILSTDEVLAALSAL